MKKTHMGRYETMRSPMERQAREIASGSTDSAATLENLIRMPGVNPQESALLVACVADYLIEKEIAAFSASAPYSEIASSLFASRFHRFLAAAVTPGADTSGALSTLYAQQWHMHRFRTAGERVYEISAGLGSRAKQTVLRGLTTDMLTDKAILPYAALYLVVPPEAELTVPNDWSGEHMVEGIYITHDTIAGVPAWRLMVVGVPKANPFDDALFHFIMPLPPGVGLEDAIHAEHERLKSRLHLKVFTDGERKSVEMIPGFFRWAMNVVFYATSADARKREVWNHPDVERLMGQVAKHPKGSHKRERAQKALKALNPKRRTYLGGGLTPLAPATTSGRPGSPLLVRTLVEGHWRNQAYGPQHSLRKLIWIEPFWRGDDDAPESIPVHVVR